MRKKLSVYIALLIVGVLAGWYANRVSSQVKGEPDAHVAGNVCALHGIDVALCTRCNPDLIPEFKDNGDWCAEHNVPESQCDLCNPGLARAETNLDAGSHAACAPHGIDVALCTRCNPDLISAFKENGDWCAEHNVPESQCELCNPGLARATSVNDVDGHSEGDGHDHGAPAATETSESLAPMRFPGLSVIFEKNRPLCPTDGSVIQFASIQTADRAGIRAMPVSLGVSSHRFEAPAETVFDQERTLMLSSTIPVTIRRWRVEPGTRVDENAVLADAESPQMASLQGEYLKAWSDWRVHTRERERADALLSRGLIDSAGYDRTIADAVAAEGHYIQMASQLRLAGLAPADLELLTQQREVSAQFALRTAVAGTLLERPAPLGSLIESGTTLAIVGEPDAIWIEASVRDRDLSRVHTGQRVDFISDAGDPEPVVGTVIWISQYLDPHTRTGIVRVKPTDRTSRVRARQFGRLQLPDGEQRPAVVVPRDAVQWDGCCNVVFVQESAERFRPRKVKLETGDAGYYRVLEGLRQGENVVTEGSYLLKTELLKSSIGAGCCGLDAAS